MKVTRYLKRQVSSDPDYAEVKETEYIVSDDSIYFAKARIVVMNRYGAKEQYDDLWFCVCRRDTSRYMMVWGDEEHCLRGVEYMSGKHNRKGMLTDRRLPLQPLQRNYIQPAYWQLS